jgi:predicted metal-dependent hydrolase
VVEQYGKHSLCLLDNETMRLTVSPGTTTENRRLVVDSWYRQQLKGVIPELLEKWQPITGKRVNSWGVKRMKTRWGSCNITEARIWLNLELARRPLECLEYVLVHELVHLHERYHNQNFKRLMDRFLPGWRERRDRLKQESLVV